jgi:hypothetical protein
MPMSEMAEPGMTSRYSGERGTATETERLVHYSKKPLGEIRSVKQVDQPDMKPRGLWFSVEQPWIAEQMGWREWCEAEQHATDRLEVTTEIAFRPDARILRLSGARDIDQFHAKYNAELIPAYRLINWSRVAAEYQAIIIAPYIWSRRLDRNTGWYYSWDCASGCIWDAAAVAELRPIVSPVIASNAFVAPSDQPGEDG